MKLLVLDNYDSFTYNLVHLIENISDISFEVIRNDKLNLDAVQAYDKILLSPGPGLPADAGIMPSLISQYGMSKNILGVCLGLQGIAEAYGSILENLTEVYHGLQSSVYVKEEDILFADCPRVFPVGRYHSWVVDNKCIGEDLIVTAVDENNKVMALRHARYKVYGVQFHPESILTDYGEKILQNWILS